MIDGVAVLNYKSINNAVLYFPLMLLIPYNGVVRYTPADGTNTGETPSCTHTRTWMDQNVAHKVISWYYHYLLCLRHIKIIITSALFFEIPTPINFIQAPIQNCLYPLIPFINLVFEHSQLSPYFCLSCKFNSNKS